MNAISWMVIILYVSFFTSACKFLSSKSKTETKAVGENGTGHYMSIDQVAQLFTTKGAGAEAPPNDRDPNSFIPMPNDNLAALDLNFGKYAAGGNAVFALDNGSVSIDLRKFDTPVKQQGNRRTCAAFATIAAMENKMMQLYGDRLRQFYGDKLETLYPVDFDLSEEHLFAKITSFNNTTWLGWVKQAAMLMIGRERDLPYNPDQVVMTSAMQQKLQNIVGVVRVNEGADVIASGSEAQGDAVLDLEGVIDALKQGSPIVLVVGDGKRLVAGNDGIIHAFEPQGDPGHVMMIAGIHVDPAVPGGGFLVLKNSWGPEKWDQGYGYLTLDHCKKAKANCYGWKVESIATEIERLTVSPPAGLYKSDVPGYCDQKITYVKEKDYDRIAISVSHVNCPHGEVVPDNLLACLQGNVCENTVTFNESLYSDSSTRYFWTQRNPQRRIWYHFAGK